MKHRKWWNRKFAIKEMKLLKSLIDWNAKKEMKLRRNKMVERYEMLKAKSEIKKVEILKKLIIVNQKNQMMKMTKLIKSKNFWVNVKKNEIKKVKSDMRKWKNELDIDKVKCGKWTIYIVKPRKLICSTKN